MAAPYRLRQGIIAVGHHAVRAIGFPFEKFMTQLLQAQDSGTGIVVLVDGRFLRHAIEVVVTKAGRRATMERKYRYRQQPPVAL